MYSFAAVSFGTASTTATTTSPPAYAPTQQIQQRAALLRLSDRALLTTLHRPGSAPSSAPGAPPSPAPTRFAATSEPPAKRIRLDSENAFDDRLLSCMRRQVFPHVDAELATLPRNRVSVLTIGKQLVDILTGPVFTHEYYSRGDGSISLEFEAKLRQQAAFHVQSIARQLGIQPVPSSTYSPAPAPTPSPAPAPSLVPAPSPAPAPALQQRLETPIPLPQWRQSQPGTLRAASAPSTTPRFSSSPIPHPPIPPRPIPPIPSRLGNPAATPVIVIDDDEEDIPPSHPVLAQRPAAAQEPAVPTPSAATVPAPRATAAPPPPTAIVPTPPVTTAPPPPAAVVPSQAAPRGPAVIPVTPRPVASSPRPTRQSTPQSSTWQAPLPTGEAAKLVSKRFYRQRQPYLKVEQRTYAIEAAQDFLQLDPTELATPLTIHVDFTAEEVKYLQTLARRTLAPSTGTDKKDPEKDLKKILRKNESHIATILNAFVRERQLPRRTRDDVGNFFSDLIDPNLMDHKTRPNSATLTLARDDGDRRGDAIRSSRVHSLLFAREISGQRGFGHTRAYQQFNNEFRKCREDALEKRAEWTGCAGDIMTVVWVSNDGFICGTTEHSDSHNQQYNKPGNLVLGSASEITLRAYPEHRIVRPMVRNGENSTEAMRQSQDPWLFSSVVSSDHDAIHDRTFTSSFDRTVKIWKVGHSGASMGLLGEWKHDGNVNFVAASKYKPRSGMLAMVATAADVALDAIRIYKIDELNISQSAFTSYSCSRVTDEGGNMVSTVKWAYYPATMQWGLSEGVKHLLLVGYSPRSRTGDDNDIPLDRRDSGELLLWDGTTGEKWHITTARTQNVFEVMWHPTQDVFIAATSPLGLDLPPRVRTQIRIFRPAEFNEFGSKAFSPIKILDCTAVDINELTIMPNSAISCFITASCTDGTTYVWDTARGDNPIHALRHGDPIDEFHGDREREDVGVKFAAWGTTPDRFYTGSTDGVVKVWNVRSLAKPLIRNLLEAQAPITAGMFCPDKSRLVVGDASGRVFMLSINEEKPQPSILIKIPLPGGQVRTIRRPPTITPHPDPPPPTHDAAGYPVLAGTGPAIGRAYLASQQLERHSNPTIGVVQGPRYDETGLFRREMHFNEDATQPLLAGWEAMQQEAQKQFLGTGGKGRGWGLALRPLKEVPALEVLHKGNRGVDFEVEALSGETLVELQRGGVDFEVMIDYPLDEEE